ncbi:MAG TPA: DUF2461 domain-containing protein [Saprospiraceae bacterium]|nr:DUF2461 domain-containing protein [Saprospiraceae bacterium]HND87976.1 DUF2461 domain-containing protein [Saprospiraceae bacterium]
MLSTASLQFLYDLSQNNNRDWFEKNKKRYESDLKKPFEATVSALIAAIRGFEPGFGPLNAKDCIFRIYRDTRFSKDKSPYKTHMAAAFTPRPSGRSSDAMTYPGYYLHLEYGSLMLGGGVYMPDKESVQRIRTAISQDPEAFRALVSAPDFVERYGALRGEINKVLPEPLKSAAKQEPLVAHKQFYFMMELDPETILRADFPAWAADYFRAAKPVNDFLRQAMGV